MNPDSMFDRDLERWLEAEAPMRGPAGLHAAAIDRARTRRQRPRWVASLRGGTLRVLDVGRPAGRAAYLLIVLSVLLALVVAAIAAGALRTPPVRPPGWSATAPMIEPRSGHTATRLSDGRVLVAGGHVLDGGNNEFGYVASAELYDPDSGSWTSTGDMTTPRVGHSATLLNDGKVLVAGGGNDSGSQASAELYDPGTGTWTATGDMVVPRWAATALLVSGDRVLVVGGLDSGDDNLPMISAELYDPDSGTWTAAGDSSWSGARPWAALLPGGTVLVVADDASAELYDPVSGTWTMTGAMLTPMDHPTATLLLDGRLLVVGGPGKSVPSSAELYDRASETWTATGDMVTSHCWGSTATRLLDGRVLVTGGAPTDACNLPPSAELYDPAARTWTDSVSMDWGPRLGHTATLLADGRVLVVGGGGDRVDYEALYDPGSGG